MAETTNTSNKLGIGALSKATGIPVETLRTWERRYGFPNPERTDSGHRIYSPAIVDRLKLVDKALTAGHRASKVVSKDVDALRALLGLHTSAANDDPGEPWSVRHAANARVQELLRATAHFDGDGFESALRNDWHTLGALTFLEERVGPFLEELGIAWAERRMEVAHEHFASERLRDFLTTQWRPVSDRSRGPRVVCATLPGESHYLGLQIASTVLAIAGCRVTYLGCDTPADDIAATAKVQDARAVLVSVSIAANRFMVTREIGAIREKLNDDVELVVGGRGAPDALPDVMHITALSELLEWATMLAKSAS